MDASPPRNSLDDTGATITSPHRSVDPFPTFGDATLEEVAERLGHEVRYGLVKTATHGNTLRVPLGDGSEVLSVTWAAIARIRAELSERSGGRIRFEDMPRRGGPAVLSPMQTDRKPSQATTRCSFQAAAWLRS